MRRLLIFFWIPLLIFSSCHEKSSSLRIAASSTPHAEILEKIKPEMKKRGVDLDILVIDDYQLPNRLLEEKEIDANFFQHEPFLEKEIAEFGYHLLSFAKIHIEPLGLYSKKIDSLENLAPCSTITIPSDPTNEARALRLLEKAHLITLKKEASIYATIFDIAENRLNLKIEEIDAPLLSRTLLDVDLSVIPGNFAFLGAIDLNRALLKEEDSDYANILAIRKGDETRDDLKLLSQILTSEMTSQYIDEQYKGKILSLKNSL